MIELAKEERQMLLDINGLTIDSRQVKEGFLFAALPGHVTDGRRFIESAIKSGATHILAPKGTALPKDEDGDPLLSYAGEPIILIESENPRLSFSTYAAHYYQPFPDYIAAVTGTNGKTSTAFFTTQILDALGLSSAALGTLGIVKGGVTEASSLTTPPADMLYAQLQSLKSEGVNHMAMEASSHGLDQYRLHGLGVCSVAFTNLTRDHLDYHGTMEEYFKAKAKLFTEVVAKNGSACINIDDEYGVRLFDLLKTERPDVSLLTVGYHGEHFKINSVSPVATGLSVQAQILGEDYELSLPLVGSFQAMNVLTALGLIYGLGIQFDKENLSTVLKKLVSVPGRMDAVIGHPEDAGVYIDYAHTPDALETVLSSLRSHVQGRLVCVFGCGGNRDKGKRPLMGQVVAKLADHVIVTDDNPRHENPEEIRSDILSAVPDAENIADRKAAIQHAVSSLKSGDVLVIAGKGHETGQIISGVTFPFDDKQEAKNAIALMQGT